MIRWNRGAATHACPAFRPPCSGRRDLQFPSLLGGGRARRKEAASSLRPGPAPAPAPTLTLVDGLKSAREVTVLAITVHFTPERRHRNPPAAAARHLGGDAGKGRDDLCPGRGSRRRPSGGGSRWLLSVSESEALLFLSQGRRS